MIDWTGPHAAKPNAHHNEDHKARHQSGGADEIDITGLTGGYGLAALKTDHPTLTGSELHSPKTHAASHAYAGGDEVVAGFGRVNIIPLNVSGTVGTWTWGLAAGYYADGFWLNSTNAQNDETSYQVRLPPGEYTVSGVFGANINRGIVTIEFDDVDVGTIDLYSASSVPNSVRQSALITVVSTVTKITLAVKTKNPSSSGYACVLSALEIMETPT